MIVKIRVQCLPQHREQVSHSLRESFLILEESKPQKVQNSKLIKVFFHGVLLQEGVDYDDFKQMVHSTSK